MNTARKKMREASLLFRKLPQNGNTSAEQMLVCALRWICLEEIIELRDKSMNKKPGWNCKPKLIVSRYIK
jgi:hypothetical protein